ncbi:MAG: CoA transferase [Nitratireductor sp.]|nr:CoA transferase [Nitratireductor sp.]
MRNDELPHIAKPLDGIRVLDFSHAAAGPFAAMFLGDLGAEIIKIERPPRGDGARSMGVPMPGEDRGRSDYYVSLNRNKKSVALDLSKVRAVELGRELAGKSDVVLQNFRPGVMDRLGLGFADLSKIRPGLVYCSISAFGSTGPLASQPANDIIMQSMSGLMGVTGEVGGGPVRIGAPISDYSTGLFALSGILAALMARDRHPEGQHIEVAMLEASMNLMANYIPSVAGLGHKVPRLGRAHAQIVPYQAFMCGDDEYIMVGAFTRQFWKNLAREVGHEEWTEDPKFATNPARLENRDELIGMLEEIFCRQPREIWLERLLKADVPCSPVLELHDAVHMPQVLHNKTIVETTDATGNSVPLVRFPVRVENWGEDRLEGAPALGANTDDVLKEVLSLSESEIASARSDGTFG